MQRQTKSPLIVAIFVALALLLSACSSGGMLAATMVEGDGDENSCFQPPGDGEISGSDNLQRAFNYLTSSGLSPEMAAGITGNLQTESSGANPGLAEWGYESQFGWGVPAGSLRGWGIVQWTYERHANVREYVSKKLGKEYYVSQYSNPTAEQFLTGDKEGKLLQAQLEFLLKELQDPYYKGTVYTPMTQASTPEQASEIFLRHFEIPAGVESQVPIRASQARAHYDKWASSAPSKGEDPSTGDDSDDSGSGGDVDSGESSGKFAWMTDKPVTMTSPYGQRLHPIDQVWKLHDGIDYGGGGNLYAITDGKIEMAKSYGGFGLRVVLRLSNGQAVAYNHLASMSVKEGQTVKAGDVVGVMGTTGSSTGVHLHFNVYKSNVPLAPEGTIDPAPWLDKLGFDPNTGKSNGKNPELIENPGGGDPGLGCPPEDGGDSGGGDFPDKGDPNDPSSKNLTPETLRLLAVIRQEFPEVEDIGGWRPTSASGAPDHQNGEALDIMTYKDKALGDRIAQFLTDNAEELQVDYVIWNQQIWNPPGGQNQGTDKPGEWRDMEDRGSPTTNHKDHVHVTTINNG